jgi:gluconate kinase
VTGAIDLKLGGIEDDIEQRMQEVRDNKFIPEEQKNATLAALQALDDLVEVIRVVSQTSIYIQYQECHRPLMFNIMDY